MMFMMTHWKNYAEKSDDFYEGDFYEVDANENDASENNS